MTFISYAQNFEDVMLWRVLKHIEHGFYIDVGAAWPDEHSVTKAFYEYGWHGINIEPNPELNRQLIDRRPRDINLQIAVGEREETLTMNFIGYTGLSTLNDGIAEGHIRDSWNIDRQEVQVTTLAAIWQQHVASEQAVHFLKVDVEGLEEAVLRGNDWTMRRPWVVVVEATLPMSQVESHDTWEPILLAAKYRFAYADGLNRFYVADEHMELLPAFKYPPNVFDAFLLRQQQESDVRAEQAEAKAEQAEAASNQALMQLRAVYASTSWRITVPVRTVGHWIKKISLAYFKPKVRLLAHHAALYVRCRPWLHRAALGFLHRFPFVRRYVFTLLGVSSLQQGIFPVAPVVPTDQASLTPRARQIYTDLKSAIERHQQGKN